MGCGEDGRTGSVGIGQLSKNMAYISMSSLCPNPYLPPALAPSSYSYSKEYERKGRGMQEQVQVQENDEDKN